MPAQELIGTQEQTLSPCETLKKYNAPTRSLTPDGGGWISRGRGAGLSSGGRGPYWPLPFCVATPLLPHAVKVEHVEEMRYAEG